MTAFSGLWWLLLIIALFGLCEIFPILGYIFTKIFKACFIALWLVLDLLIDPSDIRKRGLKAVWKSYVDQVWSDDV